MKQILAIYKPIGYTPLQAIEKVRELYPQYKEEKITYAGRLDPLAHGVLLLLIGEAVHEREDYLDLQKTYEFEALFITETDTYDILGIPHAYTKPFTNPNVNLIVNSFVSSHIGKQIQSYPPYSSKPVNGKPLFWWAKEHRLSEITIPTHEIEIYKFEILSFGDISKNDLQKKVRTTIASVSGDFRQESIQKRWEVLFHTTQMESFQTAKFRISCSSGTYIRGLVHELGKELGVGAIALDILRTAVGDYTIEKAITVTSQQ